MQITKAAAMPAPAHAPLTVNQLIPLLQQYSASGGGGDVVSVPYTAALAKVGSSPSVAVLGVAAGFDWDSGRAFLTLAHPLGERTEAVKNLGREVDNRAGRMYRAWSILNRAEEAGVALTAEQLVALKQLLNPRA